MFLKNSQKLKIEKIARGFLERVNTGQLNHRNIHAIATSKYVLVGPRSPYESRKCNN